MNELEWLADERPDTDEPSALATKYARDALIAHTWGDAPVYEDVPAPRPRRRVPRRRTRMTILAGAAIAAGVVAIAALPGGDEAPATHPLAAKPAVAAPLVRLSRRIQQQPQDRGDATLVLHKNVFPHDPSFTGADLYTDAGPYYYAQTKGELTKDSLIEQDYTFEIKAALAAQTLPPAQARQKMIDATFGPAGEPSATVTPSPAEQEKLDQIKIKNGGKLPPPASQQTIDDNRVWIGATDALLAGAGRKDVRAGVMTLLATIKTVRVSEGTDGGHAVVSLTATDYPDGYEESYIVDATTGIPLKMVGGVAGKPPDVTVTYDIQRVTAADVLRG